MLSTILESSALCFLYATLVTLCLTPLLRNLAREVGLVDNPDGRRKLHDGAIPLSGGFAVMAGFLAPILCLLYLRPGLFDMMIGTQTTQFIVLLAGALIALAMGAFDDLYDLRPRYKLLLQWAAATIAFFGGIAITSVSNPFGGVIELGIWSYPLTVFWFLAVMNAINLLDGLDGLATGVGLFVCLTMTLVSLLADQPMGFFLGACLSGALVGFLVYNFNPASVFLGDGGSMLIGFLVAALSLISSVKAGTTVALIVPFVALGLPVFDTGIAMVRRWGRRLPVSAGDRRHIHHVLISLGLTQRAAVLILYLVCVSLGMCALLLAAGHNAIASVLICSMAIVGFVGVRAMGVLNIEQICQRLSEDRALSRWRSQASVAVEQAMQAIAHAKCKDIDQVWEMMQDAFPSLGPHMVVLSWHYGTHEGRKVWQSPDFDAEAMLDGEGSIHIRARLKVHDQRIGTIEFRQPASSTAVHDLQGIVFRLRDCLCEHFETTLERTEEQVPQRLPRRVEA